jgi:ATP-dependent Clp protease ATP-binding subunit ClpC
MPLLRFGFTAILQQLDAGSLAEPLLFPEVSAFAFGTERLEAELGRLVRLVLRGTPLMDVHRRRRRGTASVRSLKLSMTPPRDSLEWRTPLEISLPVVCWGEEKRTQLAYVPALSLPVVCDDSADISRTIATHIFMELGRRRLQPATGLGSLCHFPEKHPLGQLLRLVQGENVQLLELSTRVRLPTSRGFAARAAGKKARNPALNAAATELTTADLKVAHEMGDTLERLAGYLTGKRARSVLLVGKSGVGKTALVHQLVRERETRGLGEVGFWATTGSRIVAGMSGFGMWQQRCLEMCQELKTSGDLLHLGSLLELSEVGQSTHNAQSIAAFLAPVIARGDVRAIVECTPEQLALLESAKSNLVSAFQQMPVEEPDAARCRSILIARAQELATAPPRPPRSKKKTRKRKKVRARAVLPPARIDTAGIEAVIQLHARFATYSATPGRQLRFLDDLLTETGREGVSVPEVVAAFSRETGIPPVILDDELSMEAAEVERFFSTRVLGQMEAIRLATGVLLATKARLNRPGRPIASLLLVGPTGVGKTELAKTFAEYLFGDKSRLVRFDMSEFSDLYGVTRLIGGAGGSEGLLTARVREQPFAIVLLDEIEKADPAFLDLLLQILGEARLTDARGRVADFSNCVVVLTSNMGADTFQQGEAGFGAAVGTRAPEQHFVEAVRSVLRPELFNRIDRIIPFLPLDRGTILAIARRELELIQRRDGFERMSLTVSNDVAEVLAMRGYDPRLGARPLRRAMERELLLPLARARVTYKGNIQIAAQAEVASVGVRTNFSLIQKPTGGRADLLERVKEIGHVRRALSKFRQSRVITRLQNEAYTLEKLQEKKKSRRKAKGNHPQWNERSQQLRRGLEAVEELVPQVHSLEDELMLAFQEVPGAAAPAAPAEAVRTLSNVLQNVKETVLLLTHTDPDRITLALFGEHREALSFLMQLYVGVIRDQRWGMTTYVIRRVHGTFKDRPELVKELKRQIDGSLDKIQEGVVGFVMRIQGSGVRFLFESEAGLHVMGDPDAKNPARCLVEIPSKSLEEYKPPDFMRRPGSLRTGLARRTYDIKKQIIVDPELEREFALTPEGLKEALRAYFAKRAAEVSAE